MRRITAALLACLLLSGCSEFVQVRVRVGALDRQGRPNQSVVLAADGSPLATLRVDNRTDASFEALPGVLIDAVVAAEDRSFFLHDGVDARAIARAAVANRRAGRIVEGGSTITQQLAKYRWLPDADDDFGRKVVEAHLARQLEEELTKEEILVEYLNSVYFGAGAYGVSAAAETYFGVAPRELDLPRAALLAGLIRSPESASPYREPEEATALRTRVLEAMVETGAISPTEAAEAGRGPLGVQPPPAPPDVRFPWFVEHVKRTLLADHSFGRTEGERLARLYGGGLTIHTTIDPALQEQVEAATRVVDGPDEPEVAAAVIDPHTGRLLAAVSGRDFERSQFDLAVQSRRQPGSTFKTFALVAALEDGWRLDDVIDSHGATFTLGDEDWVVRSSTSRAMSLRQATALSSNGAYARLALAIGGERIATQARKMGLPRQVSSNPSNVLGGLTEGVAPVELASAYGSLATGGVHVPMSVVTRVTAADGSTVWQPDVRPRVATDAATAWLTTRALADVIEDGTGQAARIDRPAAGKTGTVQNNTDAWFVGYTPDLVAAVWMGHPEGVIPMRDVRGVSRVEGGTWPARIWRDLMLAAHEDRPARDFPYPSGQAVTVLVDPVSGQLATEWCPETEERTGLPGEVPAAYCTLHGPPPPPPRAPTEPVTTTAGAPGHTASTPRPTPHTSPAAPGPAQKAP